MWQWRIGIVARIAALLVMCIGAAPAYAIDPQRPPPTSAACLRRYHRPCLTPAQIRAVYGIDTLLRHGIRGQGRSIAIVVSFGSPTLRSDLRIFDRAFGLPDPRLTILAPLGVPHQRSSGWASETTLDVEWAHVIAPAARIVVLESPVDETEGLQGLPEFLALEKYAVRHGLADVISQSWGATEDTLLDSPGRRMINSFHRFYMSAVARGITVVASSGDTGAAGIDRSLKHFFPSQAVSYPASDPEVLGIGGTRLLVDLTGRSSSEVAWPGSGGGASKVFAQPMYQRGIDAPYSALLAGRRGIPDVAANGSDQSPLLIYHAGWHLAAGTSAAAPQWAGLVALSDSAAGCDLGLLNERLYALARTSAYSTDFQDILLGRSVGPASDGARLRATGFAAGPGWDAVTGLGSPRAAALLPDLLRSVRARLHTCR